MDFGGDGKVAKKMQDKLKTLLPEASLFLASLDDDLTKVTLFATASDAHVAAGLDCKAWCDSCIAALGNGKGGGRNVQATAAIPLEGSSRSPEESLALAIETAKQFVASKGL